MSWKKKTQDPLSNRARGFPAHGLPMVLWFELARMTHGSSVGFCVRHSTEGCLSAGSSMSGAWLVTVGDVEVVARCPRRCRRRGSWVGMSRPCPCAYPRRQHDQSRGPSLRPCCSSRPSAVLRPPRTSAAQRSFSTSPYTSRFAPTRAAQTDLSCSSWLLASVRRPIPRGDPRRRVGDRYGREWTWPSP